ncbi:MAG: hypothetical protein ACFFD5_14635 [Candidatus Thorarchaeota archaeon]
MPEIENFNEEEIRKLVNDLNEKIGKFSSILEKFGLDIITKMGQTNLKVNMLTDKINELHKATLDIKSLAPQLSNVIENQKGMEKELDLLKSLIANISISAPKKISENESIERDKEVTNKKDLIFDQLDTLKSDLKTIDDPESIKTELEYIKEQIFEFTGGHRILYEISQIINRLENAKSLSEQFDETKTSLGTIETQLADKITFWKNKLMIKDKKVK